jgi:hypothetical protein
LTSAPAPAGSAGRSSRPGDDYVGVDLSAGMLRVFADRCAGGVRAMLV